MMSDGMAEVVERRRMTARILIVDDVPANTRLLEAKLSAEYFQVASARHGYEALQFAREWQPDLIFLDIMMPGMDGYECCRQLKADPTTVHIPIVMVTALGEPSERLRGLDAGADDFLTKPVEYYTLMARTKSLIKLKRLLDEWRARSETARSFGLSDLPAETPSVLGAQVLIVEEWSYSAKIVQTALAQDGIQSKVACTSASGLAAVEIGFFDLIIISLTMAGEDALKLIAALHASDRTHETPVLIIADFDDRERVLRSFELGASDWLTNPVESNELRARAKNQIRRKLYQDRLRSDLGTIFEMAVTDPLTGLYNQRYFRRRISGLIDENCKDTIAILMIDVDHFKSVNDKFGHTCGDAALRLIAETLRNNTRVFDVLARYGGEEFVVLMPSTTMEDAVIAGERLRSAVEMIDFTVLDGEHCPLSVSIGLASSYSNPIASEQLLKAADCALYEAKRLGRNRVEVASQLVTPSDRCGGDGIGI